MAIQLITYEQALMHSRIAEESDEDPDVDFKISQASAIAMTHMKRREIPDEWIDSVSPLTYAIPFDVQAAVLLMFGELYENREATSATVLSEAVQDLLRPYRDPTMA